MSFGITRAPLLPAFLLLLALLLAGACSEAKRERAIGEGYVGTSSAQLRDRLGVASNSVGSLKAGDRVEILQKRRRWVRIRTAAKLEGWLEERHIVPRELYERGQQLVTESLGRPSQGGCRAHVTTNLHVDPDRRSATLFQLQEGEECELIDHRAAEVPGAAPPATTAGAPAAAAAQPGETAPAQPRVLPKAAPPRAAPAAAAKKGQRGKGPPAPAGPQMEDWLLVRSKGKAGWGRARAFEMTIPDEVAQYAEGKAITAWQVLNEVRDGETKKPQYIWATSDQVGSPCDFQAIRVFTWNTARRRYETSYRERNLCGVYPLAVDRGGENPTFVITTVDQAGNRTTRQFVLVTNIVRRKE